MKTAFFAVLTAASLAACTQPNTTSSDTIKIGAYGLETAYVAYLDVATTWAKLPRCGAGSAPPPACSTAKGVIRMDTYRMVAKSALDALKATNTMEALVAAQTAVTNFQNAVNTSKGG